MSTEIVALLYVVSQTAIKAGAVVRELFDCCIVTRDGVQSIVVSHLKHYRNVHMLVSI